jgi:hypothetical protein
MCAGLRLFLCVAADLYDDVFGRTIADIPQSVQRAKSHIKDASRSGAFRFAIVLKLERPLFDDDQLRVLDAVSGTGFSSGGLHGRMGGNHFAGGEGAGEYVTTYGAVGGGLRDHLVVVEDTCGGQGIDGGRLRGSRSTGECEGKQQKAAFHRQSFIPASVRAAGISGFYGMKMNREMATIALANE